MVGPTREVPRTAHVGPNQAWPNGMAKSNLCELRGKTAPGTRHDRMQTKAATMGRAVTAFHSVRVTLS